MNNNTTTAITCTAMSSDGLDALIAQGNLRDYSQYIEWEARCARYSRLFCEKELERGSRDLAQMHLDDARKCDRRRRRWERQAVAAYYEMHAHGARSYESLDQPTWRGWHRRYGFITICEPSLVDYRRIDHLVYAHEMEE